jgi:hypothetical protein
MCEPVITGGPLSVPGAHTHHIANGINADQQTKFAHPAQHQVATSTIFCAERQATDAIGIGTNLAQLLQPLAKAGGVDAQGGNVKVHENSRQAGLVDCHLTAAPRRG